MDFIERLFHISPDGGAGFVEFGIFVAGMGAVAAIAVARMAEFLKRHVWRHDS